MIDGLSNWMDEKGFRTIDDFRGLSLPKVTEWKHLDLNYKIVARINPDKCIGCDLCYIACWDGAHQCIHVDGHAPAGIGRSRQSRAPLPSRPSRSWMRCRPPTANARRPSASPKWTRRNASAATSAGWFARWRTASPWNRWIRDGRANRGSSACQRNDRTPDSQRHGGHGDRNEAGRRPDRRYAHQGSPRRHPHRNRARESSTRPACT